MTRSEQYLTLIKKKSMEIEQKRKQVNILETEMNFLFCSDNQLVRTTLQGAMFREIARIKSEMEIENVALCKLYNNYKQTKSNQKKRRSDLLASMYTQEREIG